jgi:hypothetical protein
MFRMKRTHVPYVLLWLLVVSIFAAQGLASSKGPIGVSGTFTITTPTSGLAFKINDPSATETASVSLQGTYEGVGTNGKNIKLHDISGSITIGATSYALLDGHGVYDPGTGHIIITAHVNVQDGEKGQNLILFGYVSPSYSYGYYNGLGGPVSFKKPQSKLSSDYFLAINANLELT